MFCINSSPAFCDGAIGLSAWLAGIFTVRQLHPAGCGVGVPSVVWEICLQQHNAARGILHTIAPLFGCCLGTICIWPRSNWAMEIVGDFTCTGKEKKKRPIVFVHILFSLCVSVLNFYPTKFSYVTLNLMLAVLINVDNNREDGAQSRINWGVYTLCPCTHLLYYSGWLPVCLCVSVCVCVSTLACGVAKLSCAQPHIWAREWDCADWRHAETPQEYRSICAHIKKWCARWCRH